jgi:hypothetical protein
MITHAQSKGHEICFLGDNASGLPDPGKPLNPNDKTPLGWVFDEAKTSTMKESWF